MKTLNEILSQATQEHWAVPHFNFATDEQLKAIIEACIELHSPVIVGTSEGERDFMGVEESIALVEVYKKEGAIVFLNADHTRSVEKAKQVIDEGYNSVHIDLSKLSLEENLAGTKEAVDYARASGRDISVEGELGYLPTEGSRIYKEEITIDPESFTKPEEAKSFVAETGINRFAPAVGNLHGIAANEPKLDFDLIKALREVIPQNVSLVLHGGSGIDNDSFKRAIELGFANIHISTELRRAWKEGLEDSLKESPDKYAPYKILKPVVEDMKKLIREKIEIFGSAGKV